MARPANQIQNFRNKIDNLLSALEDAQGASQTIDYLGGATFYRDELNKTDATGAPVYDITPAQMGNAVDALAAIRALLEANTQTHGKALARMRQ